MARRTAPAIEENTPDDDIDETLVTTAPDEWEWETVKDASAVSIIFDEIGDQFVGMYVGIEHIEPESGKEDGSDNFSRYVFIARDDKRYAINMSYQIEKAMKGVKEGQWVRIRYVADIPTKRGLNPLKDFTVDVRK